MVAGLAANATLGGSHPGVNWLIRNALAATVRLMEAYLPGLEAVVAGTDPLDAVARAERRQPL